ncbi:EAL domain-containing protein [Paenibacillus abyssi]|uniref:EAL-domain containing protein YkuI n=1 Tax=Paenibacillus abyssi TaxID=1340531 RepID=A0A917G730_9BACL|nr:EAL domain-containing protein [Paenibacillus abyssi]GGG25447.1 putative EAL-domain containing protein YkuI [Paenibacillus abyssi]
MYNHTNLNAIPAMPEVERVAACYQPIVALDTRRIVGYEVLGRERIGENYQTLGPFFADSRVDVNDQLRIDRLVREDALAKLAQTPEPTKLFINLRPSWMYKMYHETGELLTLRLLDKYRIDPTRIVVEVTEEAFRGSMKALREVIDVYRKYGCQIAIDDVGSGFSNADRIAQIGPSLLKVDIHLMKKSAVHAGYLGVLRSFSTLAEQIGASLLIEGIETKQELQRAIEIGARYVQGFLFSRAEPDFRVSGDFSDLIEEELEEHRNKLVSAQQYWRGQANRLVRLVSGMPGMPFQSPQAADEYIEQMLPGLRDNCVRVYLCRDNGIQISSNFFRADKGVWSKQTDYRGANWSWRPYFISNLLILEGRSEAIVSCTYTDLDTQRRMRTLTAHIGEGCVLFIDMIDTEDAQMAII